MSSATSWVLLMLFLFKVVPVPGDKISLPLYDQQKVVNHCCRLNGNLIFPQSKIFSALIMVCKLTSCAKQACCLLASWLVSIVLCLGDQSICFTDFDDRVPSIGVNLRGPQTLNIPSCDPPPKSVKQILWLPKHNTIDNSQYSSRHYACLALNITWCQSILYQG